MLYNPYSHSKLALFFDCQYKFKLKYIDKIKVPFVASKALPRGEFVHLVIENNFNYDVEFPLSEVFTEEDRLETIKMIKEYENSSIAKYYKNKILSNEEEFAFKIENSSVVLADYWDKEVWLRGKIDANYIEDDILHLLDYKTGKYKEMEVQDDSQVKMYAIWGFLKYPEIDIIKASFIYVEHSKENKFTYNRHEFKDLIKEFYNRTKEVETCTIYKKHVSALCEYCDFDLHKHCDARSSINKSTEELLNTTLIF